LVILVGPLSGSLVISEHVQICEYFGMV